MPVPRVDPRAGGSSIIGGEVGDTGINVFPGLSSSSPIFVRITRNSLLWKALISICIPLRS